MALQIASFVTTPIAHTSKFDVREIEPTTQPTAATTAKPAVSAADTVRISLSAQIHRLRNEGFSPNQISISLGVNAQTVSSYLGTLHTTFSPVLPQSSAIAEVVAAAPVGASAGAQTATSR